jgi:hypothetical protein
MFKNSNSEYAQNMVRPPSLDLDPKKKKLFRNSNWQKDYTVKQMVFSHLSMVQKTTGISQHGSENY